MGWSARYGAAAAALGLSLVVAGCGDGTEPAEERRTLADASGTVTTDGPQTDPTADPPTDPPNGEAPAVAYAAWLDALARRDAEAACALQAPDFTIELRYEAVLVDRAELGDPCAGFEALLWEDAAFESAIVDIAVTQATDEDALLAVRLGQGADTIDLTVRMVYHRARWRVFSATDRTDTGDTTDTGADAAPARWLAGWCTLSPDQTRAEIVAVMGEPSGEYTVADGGEPQLWWAQDQYDFRVYLDPVDDSVLELVGDYDALDEADRALLPCPELRS